MYIVHVLLTIIAVTNCVSLASLTGNLRSSFLDISLINISELKAIPTQLPTVFQGWWLPRIFTERKKKRTVERKVHCDQLDTAAQRNINIGNVDKVSSVTWRHRRRRSSRKSDHSQVTRIPIINNAAGTMNTTNFQFSRQLYEYVLVLGYDSGQEWRTKQLMALASTIKV